MDGSIPGQFESWKLSLSQAKDFSLQEVGARASLLHKNLNFLSPSKKFEPMPGTMLPIYWNIICENPIFNISSALVLLFARWCGLPWWQEEKEGCRYLNNMRSHQYFGDPKQILHWYIDWWRRKMTRKKRSCRYLNKVRRHQYIGDLTQANFTLISGGNIVTCQGKIKVVRI